MVYVVYFFFFFLKVKSASTSATGKAYEEGRRVRGFLDYDARQNVSAVKCSLDALPRVGFDTNSCCVGKSRTCAGQSVRLRRTYGIGIF